MNHGRTSQILVLAACAGLASAAFAHQPQGEGTLRLRAGDVRTADLGDLRLRAAGAQAQALPSKVVLQLDGPMDPDRRAAIEASGARILDYIPDNAFVIDTKRVRMNAINALPFVTGVVAFQPAWKIAPELGAMRYETPALKALTDRNTLPAVVVLFPGANPADTARVAANAGLSVVNTHLDGDRFVLEVSGSEGALRRLAELDDVKWIEPAPEVTYRSNMNTRWIIQSNVSNDFPAYEAGLHGEGQLIAVMDGRVSPTHCSFADPGVPFGPDHRKIHAYNTSTGSDFHGTHVAGTALGDAGAENNTRGMAYEARLVFDLSASWGNFNSMHGKLLNHYNQGAAIHTNSWGNDGTTAYDNWARAIDTFTYNNDDNLVIFAVTNGSTLRNPENAKNVLAVGGTSGAGGQHNHCTGGTGPTNDGRRKPEIYAPGCGIVSSSGSACGTSSSSGTSMATPAIAGAAALVRQYYTEGFYPTGSASSEDAFVPSGALMKATLLNGTVDMTGVPGYPSNREGWGRLLLDNSLYFDGDSRTNLVYDVRNNSDEALSTGDVVEIPFTVTSNSEELRVTLVWSDAPAANNASFAPINNLDLEVENELGITVLGNVFASGFSTPGGSPDLINNVEMVRMMSPLPGEYTLRVRGTAVNIGAQGYAVVVTGAVEENSAPGCSIADIAEPFGEVDAFDLLAFIDAFGNADASADIAEPFGEVDLYDLLAFIDAYDAGCP